MTLLELLILLAVAAICGSLGQAITGLSLGGCIVSMAVGFIGAVLGTVMARALGLPELLMLQFDGVRFPVIWSIIGATLFVAVVALLTRRRVLVQRTIVRP